MCVCVNDREGNTHTNRYYYGSSSKDFGHFISDINKYNSFPTLRQRLRSPVNQLHSGHSFTFKICDL